MLQEQSSADLTHLTELLAAHGVYALTIIFNFYQQTPSVFVEPHGNWGEGAVHLVELSTTFEGMDNVVAFWLIEARAVAVMIADGK